MKKIFHITGIVLLIGLLIVLLVSIKLYNKPHQDVQAALPDIEVSAATLIGDFQENETKANKKYLDKIIQVKGEVSKISTSNGNSVIALSTPDQNGTVICTLDPSQNKKVLGIEKGMTVYIKGVCTGFIMDVMMIRTVIVDK